jgi:hypothetical protein
MLEVSVRRSFTLLGFGLLLLSFFEIFPIACSKSPTSPAPTPTPIPTNSPTSQFTGTSTMTFTRTSSPTITQTPTNTGTPTTTASATSTFTQSSTPTVTLTPTITLTPTQTNTPTLTGTPTSTPSPTPTMASWSFSNGVTTFTSGTYYFGCVDLGPNAVVSIYGGVTFITQCFNLESGATITGVGGAVWVGLAGPVQEPGAGGVAIEFATPGPNFVQEDAGAGHGGAGATVCLGPGASEGYTGPTICGNGGPAYDDPVHPIYCGSQAESLDPPGGFGGGFLKLVVYDPVATHVAPATINGTIDMSGNPGGNDAYEDANGGGSGGAILIEASSISGTGLIQANGGTGVWGGGGGGGGIISLITNSTFSGSLSASAGKDNATPGGAQGGPVNYTSPPASGY